jgi:antitoxin MazE
VAAKGSRIELRVAKWGNGLAVRLPADSAKRLGVRAGDALVAEVSSDGRLILAHERRPIGKAELGRLRRSLARQKQTAPVIAGMRRNAGY